MRARQAVEDCEPRCRSLFEMALLLLREMDLPDLRVNHTIRDRDGRPVAEADFFVPGAALDIEADGTDMHGGGTSAVFRDWQRQNALVGLGIAVLRFTWPDVFRRREWVKHQIRDAVVRDVAA